MRTANLPNSSAISNLVVGPQVPALPTVIDHLVGIFSPFDQVAFFPASDPENAQTTHAGTNEPCQQDDSRDSQSHAPTIPRWRTLRCQVCRRPLQRAKLATGSALLLTCRRDRLTFVFVAAEGGLLVLPRE